MHPSVVYINKPHICRSRLSRIQVFSSCNICECMCVCACVSRKLCKCRKMRLPFQLAYAFFWIKCVKLIKPQNVHRNMLFRTTSRAQRERERDRREILPSVFLFNPYTHCNTPWFIIVVSLTTNKQCDCV